MPSIAEQIQEQLAALQAEESQIGAPAELSPQEMQEERAARAFLSRNLRQEAADEYDKRTTVGNGKGFLNKLGTAIIRGGLGAGAVQDPKNRLDRQIYEDILDEYKTRAPREAQVLTGAETARARIETARQQAEGRKAAAREKSRTDLMKILVQNGYNEEKAKLLLAQIENIGAKTKGLEQTNKINELLGVSETLAKNPDVARAAVDELNPALGNSIKENQKNSALYKNIPAFLRLAEGKPGSTNTSTRFLQLQDENNRTFYRPVPVASQRAGTPGNPLAAQLLNKVLGGGAPGAPSGALDEAPIPGVSLQQRKAGTPIAPIAPRTPVAPRTPSAPQSGAIGTNTIQPGDVFAGRKGPEGKEANELKSIADTLTGTAVSFLNIAPKDAGKFMSQGLREDLLSGNFTPNVFGWGPNKPLRKILQSRKNETPEEARIRDLETRSMSSLSENVWDLAVSKTGKAMSAKELGMLESILPSIQKGYIDDTPRDAMVKMVKAGLLMTAVKRKLRLLGTSPNLKWDDLKQVDYSSRIDRLVEQYVDRWARGQKISADDFAEDKVFGEENLRKDRVKELIRKPLFRWKK